MLPILLHHRLMSLDSPVTAQMQTQLPTISDNALHNKCIRCVYSLHKPRAYGIRKGQCLLADDSTQYCSINRNLTADCSYSWRHTTCRELRILTTLSSHFRHSERYVRASVLRPTVINTAHRSALGRVCLDPPREDMEKHGAYTTQQYSRKKQEKCQKKGGKAETQEMSHCRKSRPAERWTNF
jgi:hypothetical protein